MTALAKMSILKIVLDKGIIEPIKSNARDNSLGPLFILNEELKFKGAEKSPTGKSSGTTSPYIASSTRLLGQLNQKLDDERRNENENRSANQTGY